MPKGAEHPQINKANPQVEVYQSMTVTCVLGSHPLNNSSCTIIDFVLDPALLAEQNIYIFFTWLGM